MLKDQKLSYVRSRLSASYDMIMAASGALMLIDDPRYKELMEIGERLLAIKEELEGGE